MRNQTKEIETNFDKKINIIFELFDHYVGRPVQGYRLKTRFIKSTFRQKKQKLSKLKIIELRIPIEVTITNAQNFSVKLGVRR